MSIETKITLLRVCAGVAFIGLCGLSWWMDYRWKRSPFYKKDEKGS